MSVDNVLDVTPRVQYVALAAQTAFDYPFPVFSASDLVVDVDGVTKALSTHYTVTGEGDDTGGTVTFLSAMAGNEIVTIYRDIPIERTSDFQQNGPWTSRSVNDEFDRLTMVMQQLELQAQRSLRMALTDEGSNDDQILPGVAARAGKFLSFDSEGVPTMSSGTGTDAGLRTDLASGTAGLVDSAAISYDRTADEINAGVTPVDKQYPSGHVRRYGAAVDNATNDATALQNAINASDDVFGIDGTLLVGSAVTLRTGVTIRGNGKSVSKIKASANNFSPLTDANTARTNITIQDLTIEATVGSSNRGLFFDADTLSQSQNIEIHRCRFVNLFRGVELDRVSGLRLFDCEGEGLGSSLLYVGESLATGRSTNVNVRGARIVDGDTAADALGTGSIFVGYADGVNVRDMTAVNAGAASGSTTVHHAIYLRDVTDAEIDGVRVSGQRRGAGVHVFSDVGAGDARNAKVRVLDVLVKGATHYAGVRIDQVDTLTLDNIQAEDGFTSLLYLTNSKGVTASNINGRNNNRERLTGTANAMVKLQAITSATFSNVVGIDDDTGNGEYGQGILFELSGTNSDIHWSNCHHEFPGGGAIGYYGIEIASGGTLTRFSVNGWTQNGCANVFNETGTASEGAFAHIDLVNVGAADFLTLDQLHKFRCRDVVLEGVAWRYESNGLNVTAHLSNFPSSGNWMRDDTVWRTAVAGNATPGWRCSADHVASNGGTWKAMANLAA